MFHVPKIHQTKKTPIRANSPTRRFKKLIREANGRLRVPDIADIDPLVPNCLFGPIGGPNPTERDFDLMLHRQVRRLRNNHPKSNNSAKKWCLWPGVSKKVILKREASFRFPILTPTVFTNLGLREAPLTPPHSRCGSGRKETMVTNPTLGQLISAERKSFYAAKEEGKNGGVDAEHGASEVAKAGAARGIWKVGFFFKCFVFP